MTEKRKYTFTLDNLLGAHVVAQYRYGVTRGRLDKPGGTSEKFCIMDDEFTDPDYSDFSFTEADVQDIEIEEGLPTIILK